MAFLLALLFFAGCESRQDNMKRIIFLHHSTGLNIWKGKTNRYVYRITKKGDVETYLNKYNRRNKTNYFISERNFPAKYPYGWKNYPYDYYNIWVKNAGDKPYMNEPTLELLTKEFDIVIFKHCFPVSIILEDTGKPDINSAEKRVENYMLQYDALKKKMHEFPDNKFIVWTPAIRVRSGLSEDEARRTYDFYRWIMDEWNEIDDNIFIWDFYKYETEGEFYLKDENSVGGGDSHPGREFSAKMSPIFAQFIIDVAEGLIE